MIKLSANETKWSSLLAGTRYSYISIWIFDFGPEKLPGLSRNGPQLARVTQALDSAIHRTNHYPADKYFENQLRFSLAAGRPSVFPLPPPYLQELREINAGDSVARLSNN